MGSGLGSTPKFGDMGSGLWGLSAALSDDAQAERRQEPLAGAGTQRTRPRDSLFRVPAPCTKHPGAPAPVEGSSSRGPLHPTLTAERRRWISRQARALW
jgi:hypothetical protein